MDGILYAIGAYAAWGLFPIYWKALHNVPAPELLAHRIVWSFVALMAVVMFTRKGGDFVRSVKDRKVLTLYSIAAVLIGINWLTYVWGVNAGFIVETSLGYFINPLVSVLLGMMFFRERLRPLQLVPVGLASLGVIYLAFAYGSIPWISIILALSFGLYGMIKKKAPLGSLYGLTLETAVLLVPALALVTISEASGTGAFLHQGFPTTSLLIGAGVVTAIPLLMFASAARSIPLSLVGILQYIAPTIQFLIGVLVYHEALPPSRLIGFIIVWIALVIFAAESYANHRSKDLQVVAEAE